MLNDVVIQGHPILFFPRTIAAKEEIYNDFNKNGTYTYIYIPIMS